VLQSITGTLNPEHPDYRNINLVTHTFRLPRILVAFLVGMALATSGAIMQGITRNPLAEPGILGVSAGAGVAAVAMIVWFKNVPISLLPWAAFAGALLTAGAIYLLAWKDGGSSPIRLILIGVAFASLLGALTSFMLVFGDIRDVQQAYVWLTGSVYGRNWEHVHTLGLWLLLLLPMALFAARNLNILGLGDEVARSLGMHVEAQRGILLVISVALAAVAVAVAGTIGFVGLVAPHVTRRLVGPSHEGVVPISALFGGALLVLADLLGRWVIAPSELPIGIVTALIGAPYFMFLLYRHRN
jgi:iron complex transport system permease protein